MFMYFSGMVGMRNTWFKNLGTNKRSFFYTWNHFNTLIYISLFLINVYVCLRPGDEGNFSDFFFS